MAGITELKAMLADNQEATEILKNVEGAMTQSMGRIQDLEKNVGEYKSKLDEAITSRDKVRTTIKNELGIDEFTPEAVRAKLSTYASDDAIAAREKQFNELKASSATKIEELEKKIGGYQKDVNNYKLKLAIAGTDVMSQTNGEHANEILLGWIAENAQFDDAGNIIYRGPSGETLYNKNNEPMTLEDRINEIKGDESRDFVFQRQFSTVAVLQPIKWLQDQVENQMAVSIRALRWTSMKRKTILPNMVKKLIISYLSSKNRGVTAPNSSNLNFFMLHLANREWSFLSFSI